jgi:hypothetical protein
MTDARISTYRTITIRDYLSDSDYLVISYSGTAPMDVGILTLRSSDEDCLSVQGTEDIVI